MYNFAGDFPKRNHSASLEDGIRALVGKLSFGEGNRDIWEPAMRRTREEASEFREARRESRLDRLEVRSKPERRNTYAATWRHLKASPGASKESVVEGLQTFWG